MQTAMRFVQRSERLVMSLDEYLQRKSGTLDTLASAGTIGLHMVSGPLVGFAIGYGLDYWLETSPWFKMLFFVIGIIAGFMNVYEDTQRLLRRMQAEDDKKRGRCAGTAMPAASAREVAPQALQNPVETVQKNPDALQKLPDVPPQRAADMSEDTAPEDTSSDDTSY